MCNCKKSVQKSSGVKAVSRTSSTPTPVKSVKAATSSKRPSSVKRVVIRRPL